MTISYLYGDNLDLHSPTQMTLPASATSIPPAAWEALEQIMSVAQPQQVILFGSWARGVAGPNSDLDLLIIMPFDQSRAHIALRILRALAELPVPKDVVVLSPEEWHKHQALPGTLAYAAAQEGIVLYAA